jgi:hypothetical protein
VAVGGGGVDTVFGVGESDRVPVPTTELHDTADIGNESSYGA